MTGDVETERLFFPLEFLLKCCGDDRGEFDACFGDRIDETRKKFRLSLESLAAYFWVFDDLVVVIDDRFSVAKGIECTGFPQCLNRLFVEYFCRCASPEIFDRCEFAMMFPLFDDLLNGGIPDTFDRRESKADGILLWKCGEMSQRFVDIRWQDFNSHCATFIDLDHDTIGTLGVAAQKGCHKLH